MNIPCWANMRNPSLPSPSGTSRCVGCIQPNRPILWDKIRSRSRSSVVTGRGGTVRASCGEKVLGRIVNICGQGLGVETYKSYNRFITSFSMPSIALSNSVSETFFHTSDSRIRWAMNYSNSQVRFVKDFANIRHTFKKSLISFTWSLTVNVRLAKLLRKL